MSEMTPEELATHNLNVLRSAGEDLHHRNLARTALLKANQGLEVDGLDLLSIKLDIILDVLVDQDQTQRAYLGLVFQQKYQELLAKMENDPEGTQA